MIGIDLLGQLAFERDRKFRDDRRIDKAALFRVAAGACKLIGHLVAGGDAEEIRRGHIRHISDIDSECFGFHDVFRSLVVSVDEKCDLVHCADLCPCRIHRADGSLCIVGGDDHDRHRKQCRLHTEILSHTENLPVL